MSSGDSGPSGRPVAQLSFALNHYFSGLDPFAFKLTNLAIHLANGVLIFILALRLLASLRVSTEQRRALIAAGLLATAWLLHPIQLLPVLHVVQRMTSLSAFFLLMALLCHMRGRDVGAPRSVGLAASGVGCFLAALVSQQGNGLAVPVFRIRLGIDRAPCNLRRA